MKHHFAGRQIGQALIDVGLCPPNARNVEVHIPADGAVMLRYDVMVEQADLEKLHRAIGTLLQPANNNGAPHSHAD